MSDRPWGVRLQWCVYAAIVAAVLGLAMVPGTRPWFERYFGASNPAFVVLSAGAFGAACLAALRQIGGFEILRRGSTARGITVGAVLATALAVAAVVADLLIGYPEGINAPMPVALAFYPSVGLVAEIVFHVLPLTFIVLLLRRRIGVERAARVAIVLVAAAEPTFQVVFGGGTPALALYTWVHVFAIAALQLHVFRRYDFVSMYSFRLVYYALWHVLWGVLRLRLLF